MAPYESERPRIGLKGPHRRAQESKGAHKREGAHRGELLSSSSSATAECLLTLSKIMCLSLS